MASSKTNDQDSSSSAGQHRPESTSIPHTPDLWPRITDWLRRKPHSHMLPFITARRDTNPIRFVLNANKSGQIVSTCRPLAAADLGAATYRGNNPPRSLEASPTSSNPQESQEQMNKNSARFQHSRSRVEGRHHTAAACPVITQAAADAARTGRRRKMQQNQHFETSARIRRAEIHHGGLRRGQGGSVTPCIVYFLLLVRGG